MRKSEPPGRRKARNLRVACRHRHRRRACISSWGRQHARVPRVPHRGRSAQMLPDPRAEAASRSRGRSAPSARAGASGWASAATCAATTRASARWSSSRAPTTDGGEVAATPSTTCNRAQAAQTSASGAQLQRRPRADAEVRLALDLRRPASNCARRLEADAAPTVGTRWRNHSHALMSARRSCTRTYSVNDKARRRRRRSSSKSPSACAAEKRANLNSRSRARTSAWRQRGRGEPPAHAPGGVGGRRGVRTGSA